MEAGKLTVDIVPLFETIGDLKNAAGVMKELYDNELYRNHIKQRGDQQTIMVGFSDGTKDGGYPMANWSIYKAKEELTALSREYNIDVVFFDGRGGPPARGGLGANRWACHRLLRPATTRRLRRMHSFPRCSTRPRAGFSLPSQAA